MKYSTKKPHKIAMGLRVKYILNFVLFPVTIVTYGFYGLVLT